MVLHAGHVGFVKKPVIPNIAIIIAITRKRIAKAPLFSPMKNNGSIIIIEFCMFPNKEFFRLIVVAYTP